LFPLDSRDWLQIEAMQFHAVETGRAAKSALSQSLNGVRIRYSVLHSGGIMGDSVIVPSGRSVGLT
jgi:hypothetical protein